MSLSLLFTPAHEQIANKFGYTYEQLSALIYPNTNKNYRTFEVPKKSGETRIICSPRKKLLDIQQTLSEELNNRYVPRSCTHGFIKGRSIVSNAEPHTNKKYVFNIDLKDFFGSIHFGRVKNLFKSSTFGYCDSAATILAQICCVNGCIPQGAPTSPIISNIICWKLDAQLSSLAKANNCTYTRYADDITFSFSAPKHRLPKAIIDLSNKGIAQPGKLLSKIISDNGFVLNHKKVRLQGRNQRQEVTGITVNRGTNLKRSFIKQTASMIYSWKKHGLKKAAKEYITKYRHKDIQYWQKTSTLENFFINVVKGRINYIQMIKGRNNDVYRKLAYKLTVALQRPNNNFLNNILESSTFVIENNQMICQGTGFILKGIGIVTNHHVVENITHCNQHLLDFYQYFSEEKKYSARLIHSNQSQDFAILQPNSNFPESSAFRMANSHLKRGDKITVVGYPDHSPGSTPYINSGKIVSKRIRFGVEVWIIDIPINHGCSGGPVLNEKNDVVGIATFGQARHDNTTEFNGFIPISYLARYIQSTDFEKDKLISILLETWDSQDSIITYKNENFCTKCLNNSKISTTQPTRQSNLHNCKQCGITYPSHTF